MPQKEYSVAIKVDTAGVKEQLAEIKRQMQDVKVNLIAGLEVEIENLKGAAYGAKNTEWNEVKSSLKNMGGGINGILKNTLPIVGIGVGVSSLVALITQSSPLLQNSFKLMQTAVSLYLRPIGDMFAMLIRPFIVEMMRHVVPYWKTMAQAQKGLKHGQATRMSGGTIDDALEGQEGAAEHGARLGYGIGGSGSYIGSVAGPIGVVIGAYIGTYLEEWWNDVRNYQFFPEAGAEEQKKNKELYSIDANTGESVDLLEEADHWLSVLNERLGTQYESIEELQEAIRSGDLDLREVNTEILKMIEYLQSSNEEIGNLDREKMVEVGYNIINKNNEHWREWSANFEEVIHGVNDTFTEMGQQTNTWLVDIANALGIERETIIDGQTKAENAAHADYEEAKLLRGVNTEIVGGTKEIVGATNKIAQGIEDLTVATKGPKGDPDAAARARGYKDADEMRRSYERDDDLAGLSDAEIAKLRGHEAEIAAIEKRKDPFKKKISYLEGKRQMRYDWIEKSLQYNKDYINEKRQEALDPLYAERSERGLDNWATISEDQYGTSSTTTSFGRKSMEEIYGKNNIYRAPDGKVYVKRRVGTNTYVQIGSSGMYRPGPTIYRDQWSLYEGKKTKRFVSSSSPKGVNVNYGYKNTYSWRNVDAGAVEAMIAQHQQKKQMQAKIDNVNEYHDRWIKDAVEKHKEMKEEARKKYKELIDAEKEEIRALDDLIKEHKRYIAELKKRAQDRAQQVENYRNLEEHGQDAAQVIADQDVQNEIEHTGELGDRANSPGARTGVDPNTNTGSSGSSGNTRNPNIPGSGRLPGGSVQPAGPGAQPLEWKFGKKSPYDPTKDDSVPIRDQMTRWDGKHLQDQKGYVWTETDVRNVYENFGRFINRSGNWVKADGSRPDYSTGGNYARYSGDRRRTTAWNEYWENEGDDNRTGGDNPKDIERWRKHLIRYGLFEPNDPDDIFSKEGKTYEKKGKYFLLNMKNGDAFGKNVHIARMTQKLVNGRWVDSKTDGSGNYNIVKYRWGDYFGSHSERNAANISDNNNPLAPNDPQDQVRQNYMGGILDEPIFGRGLRSGAPYTFAEYGPEKITPMDQMHKSGAKITVNINIENVNNAQDIDHLSDTLSGMLDMKVRRGIV